MVGCLGFCCRGDAFSDVGGTSGAPTSTVAAAACAARCIAAIAPADGAVAFFCAPLAACGGPDPSVGARVTCGEGIPNIAIRVAVASPVVSGEPCVPLTPLVAGCGGGRPGTAGSESVDAASLFRPRPPLVDEPLPRPPPLPRPLPPLPPPLRCFPSGTGSARGCRILFCDGFGGPPSATSMLVIFLVEHLSLSLPLQHTSGAEESTACLRSAISGGSRPKSGRGTSSAVCGARGREAAAENMRAGPKWNKEQR